MAGDMARRVSGAGDEAGEVVGGADGNADGAVVCAATGLTHDAAATRKSVAGESVLIALGRKAETGGGSDHNRAPGRAAQPARRRVGAGYFGAMPL
jgi:hypothetical protein